MQDSDTSAILTSPSSPMRTEKSKPRERNSISEDQLNREFRNATNTLEQIALDPAAQEITKALLLQPETDIFALTHNEKTYKEVTNNLSLGLKYFRSLCYKQELVITIQTKKHINETHLNRIFTTGLLPDDAWKEN